MVKLPSPEVFKLDRRTLERNQTAGLVSAKEVEDALKNLPDDGDKADHLPIWSEELTMPSKKIRDGVLHIRGNGSDSKEFDTEEEVHSE